MGTIIPALRKSAKGQKCTIRIPGTCNNDPETVVFCHAPSPVKGMGNKSDDWWGAFGCSACHKAMDEYHVREPEKYWFNAIRRTWTVWVQMGLVQLPPVKQGKTKYAEKICRPQRKSKKSMSSAGFPKTLRKRMNGTIERIEA